MNQPDRPDGAGAGSDATTPAGRPLADCEARATRPGEPADAGMDGLARTLTQLEEEREILWLHARNLERELRRRAREARARDRRILELEAALARLTAPRPARPRPLGAVFRALRQRIGRRPPAP